MTAKTLQYDETATGPLHGIRVLDLSRLVAGNMVSLQLADFGADVVKIEPASGDPLRAWQEDGLSLYWKVYGRNKRSIAMNLRQPEAMSALWKLIKTADVFIENYRPGTLEKMGLGVDQLHSVNPNLIIVRVSGYGQTGPNAHLPGFGTIVEAMSGFAHRTGFPDREPVLPPLALADMIAGLYGASAVSTALFARQKGVVNGQVIDLSLLESIFSILGPEAAIYKLTGKVNERIGSASNTASPRNVYQCKDGKYLALSGSTQTVAERIFEVIGRADMITDPRFATNTDRIANRGMVDAAIGGWFANNTSVEALHLMRTAGATVGPVYSSEDAATDFHFIERGVIVEVDDPNLGPVPMHNIVPRLSGTPGAFRRPAPELGADTVTILSEVGLTDTEISVIERGLQ